MATMSTPRKTGSLKNALLGAIGVVLGGLTAGWLQGGRVEGVTLLGPAAVEGDALVLEAGTWAVLGTGEAMEVTLDMGGADLDLVHGPPGAPWHFAHFDADGLGLFDAEGRALSRGSPQTWAPGVPRTLSLLCRPPLLVSVDGRSLDVGDPEGGCPSGPLSVRANTPLRLTRMAVAGVPVQVRQRAVDAPDALAAGAGLGVMAITLGPAAALPLLAAPLTLLLTAVGLPPLAGLALLVGAGALSAAMERRGWRRAAAGGLVAVSLVAAAALVVRAAGPAGLEGSGSEVVAAALSRTVTVDTFRVKVDDAVAAYGPRLAARPADKPLVLALGSSSSGGNTAGRFWPQVLQEELPEVHVQSLAWGGATTWHVRHILEGLDAHADACVLYMGHNDLMNTSPGRSLAAMEAGAPAEGGHFVPPVPLEDARANLTAIAERCGVLLAMQEHSMEQAALLSGYADMLRAHPRVVYRDGAAELAKLPAAVAMVDPVHPSLRGQEVLGRYVAGELRPLLKLDAAPP